MLNDYLFLTQVLVVALTCWLCRGLGLEALVSWLCVQSLLANILVLKMVNIFHFDVTVADAFSIGSLYCLNLLRENHGKKIAQNAVMASLCLMLASALLLSIHMAFIPSGSDQVAFHYDLLFQQIVPIMVISAGIFTLVQVIDYAIFGYLQNQYGHYSLAFRIFLSIVCTQVLDTALFTYWALGGWISTFWEVFIWSYLLKVMITLLLALSTYMKSINQKHITRFSSHVQI